MKCPKCQSEIMENARFCTKCGCNLAEETAKLQPKTAVCTKCGAPLQAGAKFCTKCGTPAAAPVQKAPKQPKKKEKTNVGLIIAAVILSVLIIASAVVCVLVWKGTISLPFFDKGIETSEETETEASTEEDVTGEAIDTDEYFADADALLEKGKSQIVVDAEIVNGMESLKSAINEFVAKAEETEDALIADERVADAYASYVTAVTKHKDMMSGQTLSGGIYSQIMIEFNDAIAMGEELAAKGYTIDTASVISARDEFDTSYTEKILLTFNEFTTREAWSRTEAWNLMADTADNMFDPSDLDNPIRLRYAYALSWWTEKQIETEINNGTITAKGAAIKIGNLMEAMDYNPMMLYYYLIFMDEAGEDCREAGDAFLEIMERLEETQGLVINEDVMIDHFWYFNDFGDYSVDDKNGVTPENRQWIRDRMSLVTFIQ